MSLTRGGRAVQGGPVGSGELAGAADAWYGPAAAAGELTAAAVRALTTWA
jgi:hypothetical protein